MEVMSEQDAQCYKCGRWHSNYLTGRAYSELLHLSTAYQKQQHQRQYKSHDVQTYEQIAFEDRCADSPEPIEIPVDPSFFDN